MQRRRADLDTKEGLCLSGENITMRDINSTLRQTVGPGILEQHASGQGGQEDRVSKNPIQHNSAKDLHRSDLEKTLEMEQEADFCQNLRRRKRKQESVKIHRVNPNLARGNETVLGHQNRAFGKAQDEQAEAMETEQVTGGFGNVRGMVQAGGSRPQSLRRCKRKQESGQTHRVGSDIGLSTTAAHGFQHGSSRRTHDKHAEGAVGAKRATKNRSEKAKLLSQGTVHSKVPSDKEAGTTIIASAVSSKARGITSKKSIRKGLGSAKLELECAAPAEAPLCSGCSGSFGAFPHNDHENGGEIMTKPEVLYARQKTENQKLRAAVVALQNQLELLYGFAEKGSKDCGHCQSIKEEMEKIPVKSGNIHAGQCQASDLVLRSVPTCAQVLSAEDAQECRSPVGSCTSEKKKMSNDTSKRQSFPVLVEERIEWVESGSPPRNDIESGLLARKDTESDLLLRKDVDEDFEEGSDAECHLCIELVSQADDPDADQMEEGGAKLGLLQIEEYVSNGCPATTERECGSDDLHGSIREEQDHFKNVPIHGGGNSENMMDVHDFHEGIEDVAGEGACEDLSVKNSKEEDCWNSGLTRNSCDTFDGGTDNQGEDDGYIDLKCGCTSQKYGDTIGILRLYQSGMLEIHCQCCLGCIKGKPMTPSNFEKHGGRGASKKWRDTIWVVLGDRRVQFSKVKGLDAFVRRYKESRVRLRQSAAAKQVCHRDEFIRCTKCSKKRRFRRKNKEECRLFHEASMNVDWECSNYPFDRFMSCQDDEEREVRQANRGCVRSRTCQGCIGCVCLGCVTCRFEECPCRICVEFMANNQ